MDRATIYTRAVHCLGQYDYTDDSPPQRACPEAFDLTLREACARYNWTFTKKAALLERVPSAADEALGYGVFPYPIDCMKVTRFCTPGGRELRRPELAAHGILVPLGECPERLAVFYQCDLCALEGAVDERRAPLFCQGVVHLLASHVCMQLTSNYELKLRLKEEAERYFLEAITADRQQDRSNAVSPQWVMRRMQGR